ncbi:ribonuclease R [Brucella neotomae]|uniref:Ribonuclease R n=1 Tax=Brucella neotomae 5K33 TaxID=520456 RepID=A0A7U8K5Y6_BRUNE|nr:ribonuclease R [Brucella neotomae]EEY02628.1 virulence-associated protein [Brucella neotomae 5K33]KEX95929.1 ribonuclease R [Brucella neotomae 5K33]KFJ58171.1 ribonuclease R [Brucella neotomae 5K33]SPU66615.1 ribonuclease R [Brucella neotomae]SPU70241.1 ribonuclease R [Brucella neotomae]
MARRFSKSDTGRSARTERRAATAQSKDSAAFLPTREEVLKYIEENPDRAGKRELAKAFNIKGDARVYLKDLLRELADEGLVEKRARKLSRPGSLPSVAVLDITGRDEDGGLLARPAEWDEASHGKPPVVLLRRTRLNKTSESGPVVGVGDRVLAKIFRNEDHAGPDFSARVMKRLEHHANAVLGVVRKLGNGEWRLEPVNRKQGEVQLDPAMLENAESGDLVEVELLSARRYGLPRGKVRQVVGSIDSEKALSMIAIHEHEIPHVFPDEVLREAETAGPATLEGREDWREIPLITIDPADAKDHDDAVYAEPDTDPENPGGQVVIVAIADVAAYVRPGSALDREAQKRGNSVYFPDRVVPMLPERISNDLCSLREMEDRPALAVRMIFSADGRKKSHKFHRIMMRSAAKVAYGQAQAAIDGAPDDKTGPILDTVLKPLRNAYAVLKRGRDAREPLELDLPEKKILLTPEGKVDKVIVPERLDAHKLIEEFMIQANVSAAETLEGRHQPLIFRIHGEPALAKQETLREFLRTLDLNLAKGAQLQPAQFNRILAAVDGTDHQELVNQVVLRTQSQAEYSPDNIGHFGLHLRRYAHFTSPIRRYADLIVHRALIKALGLGTDGLTSAEEAQLEEISALISATERRAMLAERETVDRLIAHFLASHLGEEYEGRVTGVTRAGLFVNLATYGADGLVPISTLGHEYYLYDEANHAIAGERSGRGFRLGDTVTVRLVEALPVAGALRFEMVSEPHPLPMSTRSHHKASRAMRGRKGKPAGIPRHKRRGH